MKRTHEEAEKTRLAIIDSAVTVFDQVGYAKAKISDICKLANVTRGAFYWYFKNKEDILLYIAGNVYDETMTRLNHYYNYGSTPREKITNTIKGLCHWYIKNKSIRIRRKILISTFLNAEQSLADKIFSSMTDYKVPIMGEELKKHIIEKTCRGYGIDPVNEPEKREEIYESFIATTSFIDGLVGQIAKPYQEISEKTIDNVIDKFIEGIFHSYKIFQEEK